MAPKNRYNFGLSPLLKRGTAARDRMLEPTGGIPEMEYEAEGFATPYEKAASGLQAPPLPTDIEVQEPLQFTPELAARVAREGVVRDVPEMPRANLLPQENTPEADVVAAQFPKPSLMGGQELALAGAQPPPSAPTAAPTPVTPSAAPAAQAAQPTRLEQLAKIISMTGGAEMAPEDKRRAALVDAIGKAQQAMYAGVTRSALPATFFQQAATEQTPMNRLEQLYKASQILGQPKATEAATPEMIADLKRQVPEAIIPNEMSVSQYAQVANNLNRERSETGRTERFKTAREQTAKQHDDRMKLAEEKMGKEEWKFVTNEIGDKQKQVAAIQSTMPVMQEVVDNSLAAFNLPGGEALRALRLGQFTPEQEQMWNSVFEQLVSGARKDLFGATLTGNELAAFNVMVGLGPNASVSTKLNALRVLMKRMQGSMKAAFGGIENTPEFQDYRATTGDLTHLNPLWAEFDESLSEAAANAPKAGEAAQRAGERVLGAAKRAVSSAANVVSGALGQPSAGGITLTGPVPQQPTQPTSAAQTPPPPDNSGNWRRVKKPSPGWYNPNTQDFAAD